MRFRRTQPPSAAQPLERARVTEKTRDEERAARVGDEADVDERRHEDGRVRGDADVARARERHPRAGGGAVDGRDDRLLERADREDVRVIARAQAVADVARRLAELGQVLPDAEAAARAGDDDGAHVRAAGLLERRAERLVHRRVERVEDVRPIERDREDGAVAAGLDLGHRANLSQ